MAFRHAETDYEVIRQADGNFAVRVTQAGELPRLVTGFRSQQEAETWMFQATEREEFDTDLPRHI